MKNEREYLDDIQIKKELCLMLKKTDKYLKKNEIKYSIMSGTMLGAVRHRGFIPWDDDIDIAVLRKDYDRLVTILKKDPYLTEDLFCSGYEIDEGEWPFIKIYNKNIIVNEYGVCNNQNLWIDIFPFDGVPRHFSKIYFKLVRFLRRIIHRKREVEKFYLAKNNDKRFKKKLSRIIVKKINRNKLFKLYIDICSQYDINSVELVQDITWGTKPISVNLFDNIVDYEFENIVVKGFEDYDTYLKNIYGTYMLLPPINERVNHKIKAWRIKDEE